MVRRFALGPLAGMPTGASVPWSEGEPLTTAFRTRLHYPPRLPCIGRAFQRSSVGREAPVRSRGTRPHRYRVDAGGTLFSWRWLHRW
jgi:hypothetical protein